MQSCGFRKTKQCARLSFFFFCPVDRTGRAYVQLRYLSCATALQFPHRPSAALRDVPVSPAVPFSLAAATHTTHA